MRYFRSTRYQKIWRELAEQEAVFVLFDTETTGLEEDAYIIQLAAKKCKLSKDGVINEIDQLEVFIKPPFPISGKITEITSITNEFLADKPSEEEVIDQISEFFGNEIIVAYNVEFDAYKMLHLYKRNNLDFKPKLALDAMELARDFAKRLTNFKLGTVASELHCDDGLSFHDAMDDVTATMRVMQVCLNNYMVNPEVNGYETLEVKNISYFKAQNHKENRINVNTNKGLVYFNTMFRYWASPGDVDLRYINVDALEEDVCRIAEKTPRTLYKYNEAGKVRFNK